MNEVRTLTVFFNTEIHTNEIPLLRGAIINRPEINDVLFHNHTDQGFRYRYPLVQYKRIGGKAAIVLVGDGTERMAQLFGHGPAVTVNMGTRTAELELANVDARITRVQVWDDTFRYTIRKYLPLNERNYGLYVATDSMSEHLRILEQSLVGNILSFAKGVGLHIDGRIEVSVTQMADPATYIYKGVRMMGFDLEFKANISLPDFIGLGKGTSIGFGMIKRIRKEK